MYDTFIYYTFKNNIYKTIKTVATSHPHKKHNIICSLPLDPRIIFPVINVYNKYIYNSWQIKHIKHHPLKYIFPAFPSSLIQYASATQTTSHSCPSKNDGITNMFCTYYYTLEYFMQAIPTYVLYIHHHMYLYKCIWERIEIWLSSWCGLFLLYFILYFTTQVIWALYDIFRISFGDVCGEIIYLYFWKTL